MHFSEVQLLDYRTKYDNEVREGIEMTIQEQQLTRRTRGFRLGFSDGFYRNYENQYSFNDYAKSPYARARDRDRRKYFSGRFSLTDEGTFDVSFKN